MRADTIRKLAAITAITAALIAVLLMTGFPRGSSRLMIVSPHPDDAVLCCSGLIQQSLRNGASVHVITVTDGDAYTEAAALWFGKDTASLTKEDMRRYGGLRRGEDKNALSLLGLGASDVTHLGYPDGLLDQVYEAQTPVTSQYTGLSAQPDRPYANYTKVSLMTDLTDILRRIRPTAVYLPGDDDQALDHRMAARFVRESLSNARLDIPVFTYAIHRQDSATASAQTAQSVVLTGEDVTKKLQAIEAYRTQVKPDPDYLRSFAKGSESFGVVEPD